MQKPSSTRQKIDRVLQSKLLLDASPTLTDVYTLINQLSSDVLDLYPHIACRTQCNTCCKGTSMPVASPAEWAILHDYLLRFWSEEQRAALVQRIENLFLLHAESLWAVHDTIQQDADMSKVEKFAEILPQLADTQCPFLVDETCSAYAGRPAKCRAHGGFLFVFQEHVQLHACQSEVEKMEAFMENQGTRKVVMPVWNPFEEKIVQVFNAPGATSTILAIWVKSHIVEGRLAEEANLNPDFQALRSSKR
ncbi:hypothetical protein COW36_21950 [bacterium (Candidatus Blackallbacteria) CG17_big_fil_post_rev_8_21_14_2_50_48_46]|uniref:Zinc/iron-chelating domain-containing protein n=1 Tax=bacterium (Candidatus Blackallbacteria) CG17_big_fil_post_rev_8_21_14_2_50_48_46 TaxID=2014261 RepID=A0A2M7FYF7_9BACT|nr:MAG: hypothetical protein COW64_13380 [bacterium (Candidatus Blackallbacteria) CG18_big_fil_WC_8_21_14_2_50_49_26]PIW14282.1 MAG: hypothetical protein COW36_21950 [bacterium (Candidatus Blackallbacteria) CG17_big_fil_post_rev_8_21_14_2_50_48_46]PIW45551.1 MAG: hypothetical protein COW20_19555 [bacterium (Candidatus Blackallbacteria) CG13_big_fil_rev_8_21_14_2_50_49_14]